MFDKDYNTQGSHFLVQKKFWDFDEVHCTNLLRNAHGYCIWNAECFEIYRHSVSVSQEPKLGPPYARWLI